MSETGRIGRYQLIQKIAMGGMAEIFLAKLTGAEGFEKNVVIKRILPQWSRDPEFASMIIDEAKIVVQLNHPHIVQVHELGREEETYYIAMEYIDGIDLRQLHNKTKDSARIPAEISLMIMVDVLSALSYAHAKKDFQGHSLHIIHRDISPQNVLISFDGTVKLTDFGIAKAASRSQETSTGVLKGKFAYMSPEQASGQDLGQGSDLFAAAIVLYELLTGERLFKGRSDLDTLEQVRRSEIHFSETAQSQLDPKLQAILLKALAKNPKNRYPTAKEFRENLIDYAKSKGYPMRREELSAYLQTVFQEEISSKALLRHDSLTKALPRPITERKSFRRPQIAIPVIIVMAVLLWGGWRWWHGKGIEETTAAVQNDLKPATSGGVGTLSIQAIPWGYVSIDGAKQIETPIRRYPLSAGTHKIDVFTTNRSEGLKADIKISKDKHLTCLANFKSKKGITCQ